MAVIPSPLDFLTASYHFDLPQSLIATEPMIPRDHCKLLIYDRTKDRILHTRFDNILDFLPQDCQVLFNDTRVIKARLFGHKKSGGKLELLILKPLESTILVYIRGKVSLETQIYFDDNIIAKVLKLHEDGSREVIFYHAEYPEKTILFQDLIEILEHIGHIPLPPYMDRDDTTRDGDDYQTVFSKNHGSVAAPTASLHFTPHLLSRLQQLHTNAFLTLHVGAGTFKPVDAQELTDHIMHSEWFNIPDQAYQIIMNDKPLLAVGTTVTRTVEYAYRTHLQQGSCDLFLHPHNQPLRVNHLLTNFHLPQSTLIMLVASFIGREKALALYDEAIKEKYRFYSYGDAMLII